jgi:SAM-dependent methyltransferase
LPFGAVLVKMPAGAVGGARKECVVPGSSHGSSDGQALIAPGFSDWGQSDGWRNWRSRLNSQEWRTPVFFEIVSREIRSRSGARHPTVLDIGCGCGFDGETRFHEALAAQAGRLIGVEPDLNMPPPKIFSQVFQTLLEDAPIPRGSVDVAYAIMVVEHVADPERFWTRLYDVLAPGGVFIAFSVNGAHWCSQLIRLMSAVRLKSVYLDLLRGRRGSERYADYPVYYRTNTTEQVRRLARGFRSVETLTFGAVGEAAFYAPHSLRPMVRWVDQVAYKLREQRINILIRAER